MPETVTPTEVLAAAERIEGRVRRTPVLELGEIGGASVVAKLELLQHTGSFKPRGAFNKLLSSEVPPAGVIAASGGNFGLAVAHAARETGVPAEIFIPSTSPEAKVAGVRAHGAAVTIVDGYYAEAQTALGVRAEETGALLMHPFDQPEVIAGQGTIGIELDEQVPDVDTVLIAIGGGGLIAGIAAWFRGRIRVVGVEPTGCATMTAALAAGGPIVADVGGIAADSLGSARVGDHTFPIVRDHGRSTGLLGRVPADRGAGRRGGPRRAAVRRVPAGDGGTGLRSGVWRELRSRDGHPIPFLRCSESPVVASAQPIPPLVWPQG